MAASKNIPCPNCGSPAKRYYFTSNEAVYASCPQNQVLQTECPTCDYLMVTCSLSGTVVEAYYPGIGELNHCSNKINWLPFAKTKTLAFH